MNREVLGNKLTDMVESSNPAAVALASKIYENFLFDVTLEPSVSGPLKSLVEYVSPFFALQCQRHL